jgi:RHS repeat-associated protein
MKKYLYPLLFLISFGLYSKSNPSPVAAVNQYNNYHVDLLESDLIVGGNPTIVMGGVTMLNDVLTVDFTDDNAPWTSPQKFRTYTDTNNLVIIKSLGITPSLPDQDLGVVTLSNREMVSLRVQIKNNNLVIHLDFVGQGSTGSVLHCSFNNNGLNLCTPIAWYIDADGDGSGSNASTPITSCNQPPPQATTNYNYVTNNLDCVDNDANSTEITWIIDHDHDGYGDWTYYHYFTPGNTKTPALPQGVPPYIKQCLQPSPILTSNGDYYYYASNSLDIDDQNADHRPDNATTYYPDDDHDTYGSQYGNILAYAQPSGYVTDNTDCDDHNKEITFIAWYLDNNGDGVLSNLDAMTNGIVSCTQPVGNYVTNGIDTRNNWTHAIAYDIKGNAIASGRNYFDDLGKSEVSLSKNHVTNKIWGTETTYDDFGRPDKTSFVAPSDLNSFEKTHFLKTAAQASAGTLPVDQTISSPISTSQTIQVSNTITANATIYAQVNVNFIAGNSIMLGQGFSFSSIAAGSFKGSIAAVSDAAATAGLANYYSDTNTLEPYQATATQPYSKTNYDTLNPGGVTNVVGGNKINGDWKTGYAYTVPAAQEMYYVYGQDYYDGAITAGREEVITKFYKSVGVDANGVENVSFSDGEGKVLASARSGGTASYPVVSLIGTQGYVDVHIPAGISTGQISLIGGAALYTVYNLKTGLVTTALTGGNAYRIQAITPPTADPIAYIAGGIPTYDTGALGIAYSVNYYDYAVNVYNKTGQLLKSIQPNGYVANASIVATPAHMSAGASNFISTYTYNALGQVVNSSSPDEGTSKFAYRKDGQIRYSQSALQADTKVSYNDYDTYGRPIESGVITGAAGIWALATASPDGALIGTLAQRSEQTFTVYDEVENNVTSVPLTLNLLGALNGSSLNSLNYTQNNLAGNVAVTYTKPATAVTAITWNSYDIYGRVEWLVQYNAGINNGSTKTIHYEYDYKGNVKKVLFQKDRSSEMFVHQYTYDANSVLTKVETSTDNINFTTHADYTYYATGELKRTNIAQGAQGIDYVYTLGGQLKSINHPSLEAAKDPGGDANDVFGVTLDYYKDDYLRTGRNITTSPNITPDYNGNIKAARWSNKGIAADFAGGVANQKAYTYNYDRNNWLQSATFGTTSNSATIAPLSTYAESNLTYDANGNIKTLKRTNETGTASDQLTYNYTNTGKNQLNSVSDAVTTTDPNDIENQAANNYTYDAIGQMTANISENLSYIYNTQGLVTEVRKGANPVVKFYYNERGQRIKKESYNPTVFGKKTSTDYYFLDLAGNTMAVYNYNDSATALTQALQTELPIYGLSRLGVFNKQDNSIAYQITDHLGNVRAVIKKISGSPVIQSYADYYPFGEQLSLRNSLSNYRYAFQGQELDKETGMEAFQLRLWDGRLGRWLSPDPKGQHFSPYMGMGNNPIGMIDPDGGADGPGKGFWGRLWGGITSVFSSEKTIDGGELKQVAVKGYSKPKVAGEAVNSVLNDKVFNLGISTTSMLGSSAEGIIENRFKYVSELERTFDKPIIVRTFFKVGIQSSHFQLAKVAKVGRAATHIGNALFVADIALGGQVKASHVFYGSVMALNAIPVAGNIASGIIFGTDLLLMGGTYLYSGQATSIGDLIDDNTNGGVILNARDIGLNYDGLKGYRR